MGSPQHAWGTSSILVGPSWLAAPVWGGNGRPRRITRQMWWKLLECHVVSRLRTHETCSDLFHLMSAETLLEACAACWGSRLRGEDVPDLVKRQIATEPVDFESNLPTHGVHVTT